MKILVAVFVTPSIDTFGIMSKYFRNIISLHPADNHIVPLNEAIYED